MRISWDFRVLKFWTNRDKLWQTSLVEQKAVRSPLVLAGACMQRDAIPGYPRWRCAKIRCSTSMPIHNIQKPLSCHRKIIKCIELQWIERTTELSDDIHPMNRMKSKINKILKPDMHMSHGRNLLFTSSASSSYWVPYRFTGFRVFIYIFWHFFKSV